MELQADDEGPCVVRRDPGPNQRCAVGWVGLVASGSVRLSESSEETISVRTEQVRLEGSKASYVRCLKVLLSPQYQCLEEARQREVPQFFTPEAPDGLLPRMEQLVRKRSPLTLVPNWAHSVGPRIAAANTSGCQSFVVSTSLKHPFDAAPTGRRQYPRAGIEKFGPFSRYTSAKKSPRILMVCPDPDQGKVDRFIHYLREGIPMQGRSHFLAGFGKTFGLINPKFVVHKMPCATKAKWSPEPAYRRAPKEFLADSTSPPDAAIVMILEHAGPLNADSTYLQSKARFLTARARSTRRGCRPSCRCTTRSSSRRRKSPSRSTRRGAATHGR